MGFFDSYLGVITHQLWLIYVGYGVVGGTGLGIGYISLAYRLCGSAVWREVIRDDSAISTRPFWYVPPEQRFTNVC
jgi:hypothetical protein